MNQKACPPWLAGAVTVALLPPLWAVFSETIGIRFGWCSLACGGIYAACGGKNAPRITGGFVMGAVWGWLADRMISLTVLPHGLTLFLTLCLFGFLAVALSSTVLRKVTFLPAWLGGWALSLGILGVSQAGTVSTMAGILAAMLAGVWYIGVFSDWIQAHLAKALKDKKSPL